MEDAADARFNVTAPYEQLRQGAMDRMAEIKPADAWGKVLTDGYVTVSPGIVQKEFEIVLKDGEPINEAMYGLITKAEQIPSAIPLFWREHDAVNGHSQVLVQGHPHRVARFEELYNLSQEPTRNGWIKRYLDDFRTDVEWLRVVWLSEGPAPRACDMPGCESGLRQRWAIAYRVPCPGGTAPMDRELFVYCEATVKADNDVATFIEEDK